MRKLRKAIEIGLPILGTAMVLFAVLFLIELRAQLTVVILGLLLVEIGVWGLARPLLPSERKYHALRAEVDRFIGLVRRLNRATLDVRTAGTPAAREALAGVRSDMHASVDRMSELAGKTDEQLRQAERELAMG